MKILFVDDDAALSESLVALMSQEFPAHSFQTASSGEQALSLLDASTDLLMTDVVMEPMDGFTLKTAALQRFPSLSLLFLSGYDLSDYRALIEPHRLLQKPLDLEALRDALAEVLALRTPPAAPATPIPVSLPDTESEAERKLQTVRIPAPKPASGVRVQTPLPAATQEPATVRVSPNRPVAASIPKAATPQIAAAPAENAPQTPKTPVLDFGMDAAPVRAVRPAPVTPVPQARPGVPTAKPSAPAVATPVPRPTPVPKPVAPAAATPVPQATPVPRPVAPAAATPVPQATPVPRPVVPAAATPVPQATPVPKPVAPAAATPVPQAKPAPAAPMPAMMTAPPAVVEEPRHQFPTDGSEWVGTVLGNYQINRILGTGRWGHVYQAIQISIKRSVALRILDASLANDPAEKARFVSDARAKANAQHPTILAVFEAGEQDGTAFCAHEFVAGHTLKELADQGQKLDEAKTLKVLRAVAEGMSHLQSHQIPHSPLSASSIFIAADGTPRLANIATHSPDAQAAPGLEALQLGRSLLGLLPPMPQLPLGLRTLIGRMLQSNITAPLTWQALLQGVTAIEPKVVPVKAAEISAQDKHAIELVEATRKAQKRSFWISVGVMTATLTATIWAVWNYGIRSNERFDETMIEIPAGTYTIGKDKKIKLETFWISKHEITIGQYAKFLDYLNKHPTAESEYNHPRQPRSLSHEPKDWAIYYGRARAGKPVHSCPISLNSPAMNITWWDAFAYAKWRGQELPTAEEWEAAARGAEGLAFPWGNWFDPKQCNSNADHNPAKPAAEATVDGFNFWGDVDRLKGDKSPFGVVGMAGNVSEWTAWPKGASAPILKGGNFTGGEAECRLERVVTDLRPDTAQEHIGFRTITRVPPDKK